MDDLGDISLFYDPGDIEFDSACWEALRMALEEIFQQEHDGLDVPEIPENDISNAKKRLIDVYQDLLRHRPLANQ